MHLPRSANSILSHVLRSSRWFTGGLVDAAAGSYALTIALVPLTATTSCAGRNKRVTCLLELSFMFKPSVCQSQQAKCDIRKVLTLGILQQASKTMYYMACLLPPTNDMKGCGRLSMLAWVLS
jgi:hypothetical protein